MPYSKTDWKDRVVSNPLTYTVAAPITANTPFTLIPAEGTITESGTPLTAANLNKLETQYEQAIAETLPKTGGDLTGELTSNSDFTTTGDLNAANGNFTGNITGETIIAKQIDMVAPAGDKRNVIQIKDDSDAVGNNGYGVAIGGGGTMIIGGGESPQNILVSSLVPNAGTERMILSSDNDIQIMTGMQNVGTDATVGNRFVFSTNGDFNIGGNNIDGRISIFSYDVATKIMKLLHWTGTATQVDTVLQVGDVAYQNTWVDMTLTAGLSDYSAATPCRYTKKGGVVYIKGALKGMTAIATTIFTLPAGYRPDVAMSFALPTSGKNFARWTISTDGRIVLENVSQTAAPASGDWFPITMSFPI